MKNIVITSLMAIGSFYASAQSSPIVYPQAPKADVVDNYFGVAVHDPYRPLENDTAMETLKWVEAENTITRDYLSRIPFRGELRRRISDLNNYVKTGLPWCGNDGLIYYYENDGLKNQSVLYRVAKLGDKPEVFIDPNTLSDDGTVALTGVYQSRDGKYTAYKISRKGSDWAEFYLMDTKTKELLPDHIEWAKFTDAEWCGDGFYYSAYPMPEAGKEFSNANENHLIYYHKLGTPQSDDKIVYEDREHPLYFHTAKVADNEKLLFVSQGGQGLGNGLMVKRLDIPESEWTVIEPSQDYTMTVLDVKDGYIYYLTSKNASNCCVMIAPIENPNDMKVFIPESDAVLTGVDFTPSNIILIYERDASTHAYLCSPDGKVEREINFPTYGRASFSTSRKHPEIFYSFTSFLYPSACYSYDAVSGESSLIKASEIKNFNTDDYITEQIFYTSSDGTKVPMFLTYKKGLKRDGSNPVYLYGYGGFNVSLPPTFSPNRLVWLENGGIYAQANLRGGAEYGENWHIQGTKLNKMNVFNDFISAAEYMIKEGWTSPARLTIEGGSNGGLLIGACVNLRPDLFRVAIPRVGVMDMMRYHLFTIGWNWASDYGTSADSPEMSKYLLSYSPLHNIKSGANVNYPSIMVTTADHDDRVVPAHSFKYAATLQAAQTGDNPKLIRIDSNAGHGAGKPISKTIDEYTDIYSFIFHNLGITPSIPK